MLLSERFGLPENIPFVDVDESTDTRQFIQPLLISYEADVSPEARVAFEYFQSFSDEIVRCVCSSLPSLRKRGSQLLSQLSEPPETRLGYASRSHKGKGVGVGYGSEIFGALSDDLTGFFDPVFGLDLGGISLFVPGIDRDRISDMTTSIIRKSLIDFTYEMVQEYPQLVADSGGMRVFQQMVWNADDREWSLLDVELPVVGGKPLLLVPKSWASASLLLGARRYHSTSVLGRIQERTGVRMSDGRWIRSAKRSLSKSYPFSHALNLDETLRAAEGGENLIQNHLHFVQNRYSLGEVA